MLDIKLQNLLTQKTQLLFWVNKDDFSLGVNMHDTKSDSSTVLKKLFLSPSKMALYGKIIYGKGDLTFINISILYLRRSLTLVNRYGSAFLKHIFSKNKNNKSVKLGQDAAAFKYWLQQ